jgi:hypothetical protein
VAPDVLEHPERPGAHFRSIFGILLGVGVYFYYVFAPAAVVPFAHHDQYRYFREDGHLPGFKGVRQNDSQYGWLRVIGRPVAAELEYQVFRRVRTLEDLMRVRLLTLGLVALAAAWWACWLRTLGLSTLTASALGAATFTLPGVSFTVFMTSLNHPVAFLLALASAGLSHVALSPGLVRSRFLLLRTLMVGMAAGFFVLALLSYPASAFVILLPSFAALTLGGPAEWRRAKTLAVGTLAVVGTGCVIYFLVVRLHFGANFSENSPAAYRVAVSPHLADNLHLFATQTLVAALNLWNIFPNHTLMLAVLCVIGSGGIVHLLRLVRSRPGLSQCRRHLLVLAAIPAFLVISDLPMIASSAASMMLYRAHFACAALVLTLLFAAVRGWVSLLPERMRARALLGAAAGLMIAGGAYANYTFHLNCLNSNKELEFIRSRIASRLDTPLRRIHIIGPRSGPIGCNGCRKSGADEFNHYSTCFEPDVPHIVRAALLCLMPPSNFLTQPVAHTPDGLRQIQPNAVAVTYSNPGDPVLPSSGTIIIDMNELVRSSLADGPIDPPLLPGSAGAPPVASLGPRDEKVHRGTAAR